MYVHGSTELNLNELRDMASRQQQQIEMQQQMLVAKQQRLKFLKQQEVKHQQVAIENERLRRLRDKVEQQEMKLQKLRAMQGQADTAKVTNTNLSAELENLRSMFKEKEHELANAVAKVDQLTHQLENIRRGNTGSSLQSSAASQELERLRRELLHRNQKNEQQSRLVENQRKVLGQRKGDVILIDKRIEELTELLRQKRSMQNQQRQSPVPGGQRSAPSNNTNNNATTRSLPNGNVGQMRPDGPQDYDRSSPQSDSSGQYPGQRPPLAPRPNRLYNGTNGSDGNRQRPVVPGNKPVPAPKPSIVNHPGGFKPRTGSSVPITGPQGTPLVPSQTHLDAGQRKPEGNVDASGSETSSLTENSSLDSVPSSTSYSHLRQSGNLASNNRPGAGSPNQGVGNRWPGPNRPGSPSQDNKDLRVQVQRNLPLSQNDPRGNYLFNRPAGDRSPMYSPSGQPSSSSWDTTDLDSTQLPPPAQQGVMRHPPSPTGKKGPPPPPRNENTRLTNYGNVTPSSSAPSSPFQGPSKSFYGQANSSHGPDSTIPPTTESTDSTRPHHQRSPATVGMYAPPPNAHERNYNRPSFEQGYHNPPYYPGRSMNFHTSDLFPISDMQGLPEESEDAPISPNRPASPVKFPTLTLQRYMDPKRIHNMPRPLKKRLSYTESKDENFSFLNAELRNKLPFYQQDPSQPQAKPEGFHDPNQPQHFKQQPPAPGGPGSITLAPIASGESDKSSDTTLPEDTKAEPKPSGDADKKTDNQNSKYRNDAIMSHQQYSKALSQVGRSPIIEQTKKQVKGIKGILKNPKSKSKGIRVRFDPLALLLDASLEGEFSLVRQIIPEVSNPSGANDEGITALHNAICANHYEIVNFLIQYGVDVNSPDSDGWTPLHCAASCNNIIMVRNLVEHGACLYATTISDRETPAQKCEEEEEGFQGCSDYLFGMQNKMGVDPNVAVCAVYSYLAEKDDEVSFRDGDEVFILRKGDDKEEEWWWARVNDKEGYIPRNLLASYPRVKPLYR
ncbi:apoptosis-stimulating of p53 protein 1-like isoform X2 [Lytechinus variegatus]|uniref:apoptosis-stimulating of p53 protein 1-like isoform X2 n=1 Tax=Lytechinus variegatus TaxID=7654 RepID=UPI001BB2715C|nr:apoptosis-stimulating of p53 protein 1-like isoform X2 [Lytechinus variegatus]